MDEDADTTQAAPDDSQSSGDTNPFGDFASPPPDQNPFGDFANNPIQNVRSDLANQLDGNPDLVRDMFSLTKNEVGGQGPEAQQAFMETLFNRAAARGQSLDDVVHDSKYYPQVSLRRSDLSDDEINGFGDTLKAVVGGSNIANNATGNASGSVGFNGGPQVASYGGEKFGIEGPDLGNIVSYNGEASQLAAQRGGAPNPFGDFALPPATAQATPSPEPLPAPSPSTPDQVVGDALNGKTFLQGLGETLADTAKNIVPHTAQQFQQMGNIMTAPMNPGQFMGQAAQQALNNVVQIKNAVDSGSISSYQSGKAIGAIAPQIAMLIAGVKTPTTPLNPSGEGILGSKFTGTYAVDKQLGDATEAIANSRAAGLARADIHMRNMLQDLSPQQEQLIGDYLVGNRLNDVNPNHPQSLQSMAAAGNGLASKVAADPAVQRALDYYAKNVKPDIEQFRVQAGLERKVNNPYFVSLMPDEAEAAGMTKVKGLNRNQTTRFANEAEGTAEHYNTDIRKIVGNSYSEAIKKANINKYYKTAQAKGLAQPVVKELKDGTKQVDWNIATHVGGKKVPLKKDFDAATLPKQTIADSNLGKAWQAVQRGATSVQLGANPAAAFRHMYRELGIVSQKAPIGQGLLARAEALLPYIGPRAGTFTRAFLNDMSSAENRQIMLDLIDNGGGTTRAFQDQFGLNVPGLKQLQNKTHKLLFGLPEGRGVSGWDMRMRVYMEKIRRAAEGNADPQRMRQFANQLGQYGDHSDWFIEGFKHINPYAATQLPMRQSELKGLAGQSGLKLGAMRKSFDTLETALRGTGGTLLGIAAANYALNGKFPWEPGGNAPGHEFDIKMGGAKDSNGNDIYLQVQALAPEFMRAMKTTGLPNLLKEKGQKDPQYLNALGQAYANAGLEIVGGPAQNTALTAATGRAAYLERDGSLLNLSDDKHPLMGSKGVEHIARALAGLNPIGGVAYPPKFDTVAQGPANYVERPLAAIDPRLGKMFMPFGNLYTHASSGNRGGFTLSPVTATGRVKTVDEMLAPLRRAMKGQ